MGVEDKITFRSVDAENLSFNDNSFDAVILYTTFHHINKRKRAIHELLRITKPDGTLVIIELTEKGVELVRKKFRNHQDSVDPRDYTRDLAVKVDVIKSLNLNAYIYKK